MYEDFFVLFERETRKLSILFLPKRKLVSFYDMYKTTCINICYTNRHFPQTYAKDMKHSLANNSFFVNVIKTEVLLLFIELSLCHR